MIVPSTTFLIFLKRSFIFFYFLNIHHKFHLSHQVPTYLSHY
nr:MAG TPA: hypothetical protein [Caudoviricetes sp.]